MRVALFLASALTLVTGAALAQESAPDDCKPTTVFQLLGIEASDCDASSASTGRDDSLDDHDGTPMSVASRDAGDDDEDRQSLNSTHSDRHENDDSGDDDNDGHDGGSHDGGGQESEAD